MHTIRLKASKDAHIARAAELLRSGFLVAFPTETVYGLGARRDDTGALDRIFEVKRRPRDKPLSVLVADAEAAARYAAPLGGAALALAERYWPGPLTLVVPDGQGGTVGLRCPDCDVTLRMIRLARAPIVAPSANLSGEEPARTADEVLEVFRGKIAAVLDGGPAELGAPSTVVRVLEERLEVLREGAVPKKDVRAALGDSDGITAEDN
jgi:L-threonylcarbamoyladenylate synthase